MTSIITGDIINSRKTSASSWMNALKPILNDIGETPGYWEIFRGDSFQVEIPTPEEALFRAFQIKAVIKCIKDLDVRMSIGIGTKSYSADKITESNGEAFINSGDGFEALEKNRQTLLVTTNQPTFDEEMNLYIRLLLIALDNWTVKSAEFVAVSLQKNMTQEAIAKKLNIGQSSVSERNQRSYFSELKEVETRYRKLIKTYQLG